MLLPEAPYPAIGGGALRSASLLEYLASRYTVDAVVFQQEGAPAPGSGRLSELAREIHLIELPVHHRGTTERTLRNLGRLRRGVPPLVDRFAGFGHQLDGFLHGRRFEVAVIEHFWCAPYWKQLAPYADRTILNLHNIESMLHARCAASDPWPLAAIHRKFERACRRLEKEWFARFSLVLTTSEDDARLVRTIAPESRVAVYPNTLPARELPAPGARDQAIAFSANMEYHPNVSAVRYFSRRIWPLLRERWPSLRWDLIGKNPEAVRRYTAGDTRIRLTGPVEDAILELARARVAVVPLLAGSGTRVKILEAWAAGTPVVSTTIGAEGLPVRDGEHLLIADTAEEFAAAVSSLLESDRLRWEIGGNGRRLYEKEFTWQAGWNRLTNIW